MKHDDVCSCMSPKEKDMMRSRTWKRVLAAVCAGVAAVSMAACGGGTNNTAKDGVIINGLSLFGVGEWVGGVVVLVG